MLRLSRMENFSAATQLKLTEELSWKTPLLIQLLPSETADVITSAAGKRLLRFQARTPVTERPTVPTWRVTLTLPEMLRRSCRPRSSGGNARSAAGTPPVCVSHSEAETTMLVFTPKDLAHDCVTWCSSSYTASVASKVSIKNL